MSWISATVVAVIIAESLCTVVEFVVIFAVVVWYVGKVIGSVVTLDSRLPCITESNLSVGIVEFL